MHSLTFSPALSALSYLGSSTSCNDASQSSCPSPHILVFANYYTKRFLILDGMEKRAFPIVRSFESRTPSDSNFRDYGMLKMRNVKCRASKDSGFDGESEVPEFPATASANVVKEALVSGSPIVIIEAPPYLKTAEPMPMMRPNKGLIKPGDAGRVIDRRPKNVWAVRFESGSYLVDRKYFEPFNTET